MSLSKKSSNFFGTCSSALFLRRRRRRYLGLGLFLGQHLLEILDRQFELLDKKFAAFRGLPELLTPRLGEHQFQPLDFERPNLCLASKRKDHRMGGGKVFRKRIG